MLKSMTRHMLSLEKRLGLGEKTVLLFAYKNKNMPSQEFPSVFFPYRPWKLDKITLVIPHLKFFFTGLVYYSWQLDAKSRS